jgi:hypothetical protein
MTVDTFTVLRPAATLVATLEMMTKHGGLCRVKLSKGLRLTYAPGRYFAVSRDGVLPSAAEIQIVCAAARQVAIAIAPDQGVPADYGHIRAVTWQLQRVEL